jgi:predicted ATPase
VLEAIKIANLRGVREGELEGLSRLVVLVGSNGSGKSTVLEAAFLSSYLLAGDAVGRIVQRRPQTRNGARWVVFGGQTGVAVRVVSRWSQGGEHARRIYWDPYLSVPELNSRLSAMSAPGPYSAFRVDAGEPTTPPDRLAVVGVAVDNRYAPAEIRIEEPVRDLQFVDPRSGEPLHDLFSRAVQAGMRDEVVQAAQSVVPGLEGIEILTEQDEPRLYLRYRDAAVPATLAGDGVAALLRTTFELASRPGQTLLLEEPEVHQHPRALRACAKAIVAGVRRDSQVLLTTHSLELIDLLLAELSTEELEDPSFFQARRTRIEGGRFHSSTISGTDAAAAREQLAEDLR